MRRQFIVVGNGQPALAVVRELVRADQGSVCALLTSELEGAAASLLHDNGGLIGLEAHIRTLDRLAEQQLSDFDWLLCANTTTIVPASVLAVCPNRALNLHPGLLPAYAGLHTHQWAIRNGEREFGVSIHFMEAGIDTGDIVAIERFPIRPQDTGLSLFRMSIRVGAELFARVLRQIIAKEQLRRTPQDARARRFYRHADALDDRIDWRLPARCVIDFIRAGNYYPLTSPTYTARIRELGPAVLEVLHASEVQTDLGEPGKVMAIGSNGPIVACGGSSAVLLDKVFQEKEPMTVGMWLKLFAQFREPHRLIGRGQPSTVLP